MSPWRSLSSEPAVRLPPTLTMPVLAPVVLQATLEGWRHGRRTPPMMLVDWHTLWDEPLDAIRARHGVEPFVSVLPDLPA